MSVPYATAGAESARAEIQKILKRFGCESVGFMDNFEKKSVLLAFTHRGRQVHLEASAAGWAKLWLQENPWNYRRRGTREEWEAAALEQGMKAINSILRDWVKGQITAVECGIMSFGAVFMPHMLAPDGRTIIQHIEERGLLPPPIDK